MQTCKAETYHFLVIRKPQNYLVSTQECVLLTDNLEECERVSPSAAVVLL